MLFVMVAWLSHGALSGFDDEGDDTPTGDEKPRPAWKDDLRGRWVLHREKFFAATERTILRGIHLYFSGLDASAIEIQYREDNDINNSQRQNS